MSQFLCCLNPECTKPLNPLTHKHCQNCGTPLVELFRHRYRVLKPLGKGGFGKTYLAEDTDQLNRSCVIKQLIYQGQGSRANQKVVELFTREAEQLLKLEESQQIPNLFAYFEEKGYLYLVQDFVDGQDLLKEHQQQGNFGESKIRSLLVDLLPVLEFIHSRGVIHRDLKPENIMRRYKDGKLVLIDFGVAKEVSMSQMTMTGTVVGSPGYSSFEQFNDGKPTASSDLYSLGATCFHLMSGRFPGELWKRQGYGWVNTWEQSLPTAVSPELLQLISKLLQIEVIDRYQRASEVLEALTLGQPVTPPASLNSSRVLPTLPTPAVPSPKRRRMLAYLGLASMGVGGAVLWNATGRLRHSSKLSTFEFEVVTVDATGQEQDRRSGRAEHFLEDLGDDITLDMVHVPGGEFQMGSPSDELERSDDEGPQHFVRVSDFFMGRYPVTQAQWLVIASLGQVNRELESDPSVFKRADRPVESVSWHDAVEFCARLSRLTGQSYSLPSEAQWEYACRAWTVTPFHYGSTLTSWIANYAADFTYGAGPKGEYRRQTTDVGEFPANKFGLYDMHGNVYEWCQDNWHLNYDDAPTDGSAWLDQKNNDFRIFRGGSWGNFPWHCRSAYRLKMNSVGQTEYLGFRVVCSSPRT